MIRRAKEAMHHAEAELRADESPVGDHNRRALRAILESAQRVVALAESRLAPPDGEPQTEGGAS